MLLSLTIRDVVLIERLTIGFGQGLCALTGETGAGKSILLDSLGLALGNRADSGLVRKGADQASVSAAFELPDAHPVEAVLEEHGIDAEEDTLVLRRVVRANGRGRAYVNDQPVSAGLLRQLADHLVEIQGQFAQRGLMDPATHRDLLDSFGGLTARRATVAERHAAWREAVAARATAERELDQARTDEDFLRHALEELDNLAPQPGEEAHLAEQRNRLMNAEKLASAFNTAEAELTGGEAGRGAEDALAGARRALERTADVAGEDVQHALDALDRAMAECEDALVRLHSLSSEIELDAGQQQEIEDRYFALKDLARKHGVEVDELPDLRERFARRLEAIDSGSERITELAQKAQEARNAYLAEAEQLSRDRKAAAERLDAAVNAELAPLKLDKARFATTFATLDEADWGPQGIERIAFQVATNPGADPGPMGKIASGGELSRFLLALKVVLARVSPQRALIFDEVDSGIGGATAAAVGDRLARLADDRQLLVVTHSPQVAARADHHLRVAKTDAGETVLTDVSALAAAERREEIARMLAGTEITDEARAAADKLMGAA
jgi:DNA repair protein RecN (Recombination protein N)